MQIIFISDIYIHEHKYTINSYLYQSLVNLSHILISSRLCCKLNSFPNSICDMKPSNHKQYNTNNAGFSSTTLFINTVSKTLKSTGSKWTACNRILTTLS